MQIVNNYDKEVFNGDIGWVSRIDQENRELTVEFDGRLVPYDYSDLDEVILAYAISPFLDRMVERLRTSTGNGTIPKQRAMGQILRLLKEGETVGILLDQNMAWQEGVFVDFFGEPACTNTGVALLALKTGAAVLPVFNTREEDGRYRAIIEPEVPLIRTGDKKSDVLQNTQRFTRIIEGYIRNYPNHWLWVHQRWKTRPWQVPHAWGV